MGRFLTADSIVPNPLLSQGWNSYAYSYNNPLRFIDPSGHCGEIYTGNIDMNASINQRCYGMATQFANDAAAHGFKVDVNEISKYNIDVIYAVYRAWEDSFKLSQVVLPPPETLPIGQPFKVTSTFVGFPDPLQARLDMLSGVLDVCSWVALIPPLDPAIPPLQALSFGLDAFSVGYQFSKSDEDGREALASIGAEKATQLGVTHSHLFGHQVGGLVPMIGLGFDASALITQNNQGSVITVVPTSEWPPYLDPRIGFNDPWTHRMNFRTY